MLIIYACNSSKLLYYVLKAANLRMNLLKGGCFLVFSSLGEQNYNFNIKFYILPGRKLGFKNRISVREPKNLTALSTHFA